MDRMAKKIPVPLSNPKCQTNSKNQSQMIEMILMFGV
jgi:hypothetical protein